MIHKASSRFRQNLLVTGMAFSTTGPAFAAVIASDRFDYPTGPFSAESWNGGTGWDGAWRDSSNNAAYDPSVGSDGRLHTESESTVDRHKGAVRTLSNSYNVATDGTLWGSVSISVTNIGETSQYAWLSFMNGSAEQFRFGRHDATNTKWGLQAGTNVPGSTPASDVIFGAAAKLVFKMEYIEGNTIYSLWINPESAEGDLGVADATLTRPGSMAFDGIRLQSRASATFDDFVIGTAFSDVIPEPSSAMLAVLAGSLLLVRRR